MNGRAGFTLLEMLIVLAIIASLALLVPTASNGVVGRVRLLFAVRAVTARIYNAQERACAEDRPVSMTPEGLGKGLAVTVTLRRGYPPLELPAIWFYPDHSSSAASVILQAGRRGTELRVNPLDGLITEGG